MLNCVENVKPDFDPSKYPDKIFSYVELADIDSSIGIIYGSNEIKGEEAPSRARRILRKNDVIASSVEGSLEKVALVDEEYEGSLASTRFFQFRSIKIFPEVLLVLSKSMVLQTQLKKECTGTILTAVPNEALKRILIPIIPKETNKRSLLLSNDLMKQEEKQKNYWKKQKEKLRKRSKMKELCTMKNKNR